jgi:cyclic pyranopterin phosphate synthase
MRDSFGRDINYLRVSVTDKCNLRCTYCMPESGIPLVPHSSIISFEQIAEVAAAAVTIGIKKIRLTGGEPLVRRGIVDLVAMLARVPGIETLAMTTNGTLLPQFALPLKAAGLHRLNISLDTLDPDRFARITRVGNLASVLEGVEAAKNAGFTGTKLNMVVQDKTTHAEIEAMSRFCVEHGLEFQRIIEYNLTQTKQDGGHYERPLPCDVCNRLRLLSNGSLKPCLHSNDEIPVDFDDIRGSLLKAINLKPLFGTACTNRPMVQIGG